MGRFRILLAEDRILAERDRDLFGSCAQERQHGAPAHLRRAARVQDAPTAADAGAKEKRIRQRDQRFQLDKLRFLDNLGRRLPAARASGALRDPLRTAWNAGSTPPATRAWPLRIREKEPLYSSHRLPRRSSTWSEGRASSHGAWTKEAGGQGGGGQEGG
eukprot:1488660-Pleurochrysis_carterae.AAC.2